MEVPFIKYTANYLTVYSQMICRVLSKWLFYFYLSAHSNFEFLTASIAGPRNFFFFSPDIVNSTSELDSSCALDTPTKVLQPFCDRF